MGEPAAILRMSAAEYLEWERAQVEKHEFHLDEVFLMAGGSPRHNFLANAVGAQLWRALRGGPCRTMSADQRIAAARGERYVYADAVVVCGAVELETDDVIANPTVIVEVLSPGTEKYDRGENWEAYQRLASLTDYLLLAQGSVRIEHYQREGPRAWHLLVLGAGDTITLTNGATFSVDTVYEGAFDLPAG
jgi:Uma2 family endonuclease